MAEKAKKVPMAVEDLGIGQFLIFKSGEDWFRGVVTKLKENKVQMFSSDFGFSSRSFRGTEDNLRALPSQEVGSTKFWASACSLRQSNAELGCPEPRQEGDLLEVSVVKMSGLVYIIKNH